MLFDADIDVNDYIDVNGFFKDTYEIPDFGQYINIIVEKDNNIVDIYEMKIVGIGLKNDILSYASSNEIIISSINYENIKHLNYDIINDLCIFTNSKDLINIMKNYKDFSIKSEYAYELQNYGYRMQVNSNDFFIISIIMLIISILLIYYSISSNINYQKKTIGILRSLGISIIDVIKIFILEGLFITIIITIFSFMFSLNWIHFANIQSAKEIAEGAILMRANWAVFMEILLTPFIAVMTAVLLSTIKLTRIKPIDVIRKV